MRSLPVSPYGLPGIRVTKRDAPPLPIGKRRHFLQGPIPIDTVIPAPIRGGTSLGVIKGTKEENSRPIPTEAKED